MSKHFTVDALVMLTTAAYIRAAWEIFSSQFCSCVFSFGKTEKRLHEIPGAATSACEEIQIHMYTI